MADLTELAKAAGVDLSSIPGVGGIDIGAITGLLTGGSSAPASKCTGTGEALKKCQEAEAAAAATGAAAVPDTALSASPRTVTLDRSNGKKIGIQIGNAVGLGGPLTIKTVDPAGQAVGKLAVGDKVSVHFVCPFVLPGGGDFGNEQPEYCAVAFVQRYMKCGQKCQPAADGYRFNSSDITFLRRPPPGVEEFEPEAGPEVWSDEDDGDQGAGPSLAPASVIR